MPRAEYSVLGGIFESSSGTCFPVGESCWWEWLESEEARTFRFECDDGSYTARKETMQGKAQFWYGYKRIGGKLHKSYLGKSGDLTLERLESVARSLGQPKLPKLPKAVGNSKSGDQVESKLPKVVGNPELLALEADNKRLKTELAELRQVLSSAKRYILRGAEVIHVEAFQHLLPDSDHQQ
jgi:hypothetical protein